MINTLARRIALAEHAVVVHEKSSKNCICFPAKEPPESAVATSARSVLIKGISSADTVSISSCPPTRSCSTAHLFLKLLEGLLQGDWAKPKLERSEQPRGKNLIGGNRFLQESSRVSADASPALFDKMVT
jgi:hypothetical protein